MKIKIYIYILYFYGKTSCSGFWSSVLCLMVLETTNWLQLVDLKVSIRMNQTEELIGQSSFKWMTVMVMSSRYLRASSAGRLNILVRRFWSTAP